MRTFAGFPAGRTRFTPVPDLFFTELLPAIDDLAELQLTLYMFWALNRQQGYPRYLTERELEAEGPLLSTLQAGDSAASSEATLATLHRALDRAVQRGALLRLTITSPDEGEGALTEHYIFVNTPQGRKAIEEVSAGKLVLERAGVVREAHIDKPRPTVYELYERNIGVLPQLLVDELKEAELTYPPEWIEDAFRIATAQNARRWSYIRSILQRWTREGKDDGRAQPRGRTGARRAPRS
ncbi:MAG: DnaD domain protein [Chloroflexi bacterium]|nr:DnaD domain protein [Chloroflexota bacterium]